MTVGGNHSYNMPYIYIWYIYDIYIYINMFLIYILQLYCHICAHLEKYIHVYFLSLAGWLSSIWHVSPRKIANQASRFFFPKAKDSQPTNWPPLPKKTTILTVWQHNKCLFQQTSHLKKHVLHTTHTILFMFVCYALLDHQMKCLLAHWKLPEDRSAPKTVEGNVGG